MMMSLLFFKLLIVLGVLPLLLSFISTAVRDTGFGPLILLMERGLVILRL
jgi:hypothetical protein